MRNDFDTADWAALHDSWTSYAIAAFHRIRAFLCWWDTHRPWPANEPAIVSRGFSPPGRCTAC